MPQRDLVSQESPFQLSIDERERLSLSPLAMHSCDSLGRVYEEPKHPYRGPFQRDRDRILHSSAFRRLSGKTQVFTGYMGDYHRTRLTHTMEVSSIARTIGRALRLNEDLIEALALLHDIGHPPFGHAGEDALDECLQDDGGFSHNAFGLIIVTEIERPYPNFPGLNLSREVLQCQKSRIDKSKSDTCSLIEAQVVDWADSITYNAHDVDDAVKLGLLTVDRLRQENRLIAACCDRINDFENLDEERIRSSLAHELVDCQVSDLIQQAYGCLDKGSTFEKQSFRLSMSEEMQQKREELSSYLYSNVYRHPEIVKVRADGQYCLKEMFELFVNRPEKLPIPYQERAEQVGIRTAVRDYIGGMTDNFCLHTYQKNFHKVPMAINLGKVV